MAAAFAACMAMVAAFNHLPPKALPQIQAAEGGRNGIAHSNANGSVDYGVMQINSLWVPALAHSTGWTETAVRIHLMYDPCFNIAAAGAILRRNLIETHGDLRRALGVYHSHKPSLNQAYRTRETSAAVRMFTHPDPTLPPLPSAVLPPAPETQAPP
jgi:soluble lytic murein transglycosylase-like protein